MCISGHNHCIYLLETINSEQKTITQSVFTKNTLCIYFSWAAKNTVCMYFSRAARQLSAMMGNSQTDSCDFQTTHSKHRRKDHRDLTTYLIFLLWEKCSSSTKGCSILFAQAPWGGQSLNSQLPPSYLQSKQAHNHISSQMSIQSLHSLGLSVQQHLSFQI